MAALELKSWMRTRDLDPTEIRILASLHAAGVSLAAVVETVEVGLTAAPRPVSRLNYFEVPLKDLLLGERSALAPSDRSDLYPGKPKSNFERRFDWGPNAPPVARLLPHHGFMYAPPGDEFYPGERPWSKVEKLIATGGGAVTPEEWSKLYELGVVAWRM